jgi:hypothetical protein
MTQVGDRADDAAAALSMSHSRSHSSATTMSLMPYSLWTGEEKIIRCSIVALLVFGFWEL